MSMLTGIGAVFASVIPFVAFRRQTRDVAHIEQGNIPDPLLELPHEPVTDQDLENEWSLWKEMRETRSVKQAEVSCLIETKPVSVSVPKSQRVPKRPSKNVRRCLKKKKCINWIKAVMTETGVPPEAKDIMRQFLVSRSSAYRYLEQARRDIEKVSQGIAPKFSCETRLGLQPEKRAA